MDKKLSKHVATVGHFDQQTSQPGTRCEACLSHIVRWTQQFPPHREFCILIEQNWITNRVTDVINYQHTTDWLDSGLMHYFVVFLFCFPIKLLRDWALNCRGPFITALGRTWCPPCFICNMDSCRKSLQEVGFVEEKGKTRLRASSRFPITFLI